MTNLLSSQGHIFDYAFMCARKQNALDGLVLVTSSLLWWILWQKHCRRWKISFALQLLRIQSIMMDYIYPLQGRHGGKNRKLADHMIYILRKQAANKKQGRTVNAQGFPQWLSFSEVLPPKGSTAFLSSTNLGTKCSNKWVYMVPFIIKPQFSLWPP